MRLTTEQAGEITVIAADTNSPFNRISTDPRFEPRSVAASRNRQLERPFAASGALPRNYGGADDLPRPLMSREWPRTRDGPTPDWPGHPLPAAPAPAARA